MNYKYKIVKTQDGKEKIKEYKTLKEIAKDLDIEIHLVRKNNKLTEGLIKSVKPHHIHREFYDTVKIYNIKKQMKNI